MLFFYVLYMLRATHLQLVPLVGHFSDGDQGFDEDMDDFMAARARMSTSAQQGWGQG